MQPTAKPQRNQPSRWRRALATLVAAFAALITAGTLIAPGAAHADPGTCGNCPIYWPPVPIKYAPCASLGPIDWKYFNLGNPWAQAGYRYLIVSTTPTLDVAYGRFIENPTAQEIDGNWTASLSRTVTITSSFNLTVAGANSDPQTLALTVTAATGIQIAVARATTIGVNATTKVPPHSTMLGEFGLRSLDVVMDVQMVTMLSDRTTCAFREDNLERHTAHVPTINEGWRFTLT